MASFLVDTNCIIASVSRWHTHHRLAQREVDRRLERGEKLILAAHSLAESYSVLTRLPPPNRITPSAAYALLKTNYIDVAERIVALDSETYLRVLASSVDRNVSGGNIHDVVIVQCAIAAGVDAILTFNEKHFRPLAEPAIQIVVPS